MNQLASSFRDPAGYLVTEGGRLYRVVTEKGGVGYRLLRTSGLYDHLTKRGWLIPHEELASSPLPTPSACVLAPLLIPFISYPYEWSFSQLKDAALLTLDIQREALLKDMSLKDASNYNIQFMGSRPFFIDTLSFEQRSDFPWVAYGQFCRHFLAPLALMAAGNMDINRTLIAFLDGLPLTTALELLPLTQRLRWGLFLHLGLHARSQKRHQDANTTLSQKGGQLFFGVKKQLALVDSLYQTVLALKKPRIKTEWGDYLSTMDHYSSRAEGEKKRIVEKIAAENRPAMVWDLGGNVGHYSRLFSSRGLRTICFDGDPLCVDANYLEAKKENNEILLPLLMDLANPSPAIGWEHCERQSFLQRGPADLVLALALVHHLRITANIPLVRLGSFFASCSRKLLIEFVPKTDPMVKKLLLNRSDIFTDYSQMEFEKSFGQHFRLVQKWSLPESARLLYYFECS